MPRGVVLRRLPDFRGYKVALVDGERIRGCPGKRAIDTDFTMGGNFARYGYIPSGWLWVDRNLSTLDREATLRHEADETDDMLKGMSYDKAHDRAAASERKYRAHR